MPDKDNGSPRKPRGTRKASLSAFADDWPDAMPAAVAAASVEETDTPPERQRIAKAMARAGLCSRRDAEAWILEGRVSVNGEVLKSPARDVGPGDRIEVDGAPLPAAEKTRLFLFHKPRGLVTSDHDPEGRETIFDHLREHWPQGPRVVTVGRLDINTEGLLLLTNDGGLARMLELPKTGWLRRYRVRANGETDQAQLDALGAGIEIDGIEYAGIEAKLDRSQGANCWLTMGLREGKNREIKRVLEHLGLEVNRLIRLSFGPFQLLDLAEGAVEEVRTRVLKDQLGAALAAEAGVDFGEAPAPAATVEPARIVSDQAAVAAKGGRDKAERGTGRADRPARDKRVRAGDPRPQQSRASEQKSGERPLRRREAPISSAAEERSRPRRHVSTLRTTEADAARSGPRKRIERTDTRDRHDRTVTVERKVTARPPGVSPSAEGKRARIARSGGARRQNSETRDDTQRPDARGTGVRFRSGGDRNQHDARSARSSADKERPQRSSRESGERAAPTRGRSASSDGERRDTRPARPSAGGGDRPQRASRGSSEHSASARTRTASGGGDRREARPARSSTAGERPSRARREDGGRSAEMPPRADRPARTGPRPPRREEGGRHDGPGKLRGDRGGGGAAGAPARSSRGPYKGPSGSSGKGRPAAGGKPGGRPSGGSRPGGRPAGGGAPGRSKR